MPPKGTSCSQQRADGVPNPEIPRIAESLSLNVCLSDPLSADGTQTAELGARLVPHPAGLKAKQGGERGQRSAAPSWGWDLGQQLCPALCCSP